MEIVNWIPERLGGFMSNISLWTDNQQIELQLLHFVEIPGLQHHSLEANTQNGTRWNYRVTLEEDLEYTPVNPQLSTAEILI